MDNYKEALEFIVKNSSTRSEFLANLTMLGDDKYKCYTEDITGGWYFCDAYKQAKGYVLTQPKLEEALLFSGLTALYLLQDYKTKHCDDIILHLKDGVLVGALDSKLEVRYAFAPVIDEGSSDESVVDLEMDLDVREGLMYRMLASAVRFSSYYWSSEKMLLKAIIASVLFGAVLSWFIGNTALLVYFVFVIAVSKLAGVNLSRIKYTRKPLRMINDFRKTLGAKQKEAQDKIKSLSKKKQKVLDLLASVDDTVIAEELKSTHSRIVKECDDLRILLFRLSRVGESLDQQEASLLSLEKKAVKREEALRLLEDIGGEVDSELMSSERFREATVLEVKQCLAEISASTAFLLDYDQELTKLEYGSD